jgi:anti-sigma regulatory factor (Ser/Thr protein kinase)
VVLDVSGVGYADSSALSVIVRADRALQPKSGRLVIAGATRNVTRVLELSGLVGVAPTVSSAADAGVALAGLEMPTAPDELLWSRSAEMAPEQTPLAEMRAAVLEMLEPVGLDEATAFDIRVAVGEALSNAVRHGSGPTGHDTVDVTVSAYTDRVVVEVADRGAGYGGQEPAGGDPYADSGRGVGFMRALMDAVDFTEVHGGGTRVRLTKHIAGAHQLP